MENKETINSRKNIRLYIIVVVIFIGSVLVSVWYVGKQSREREELEYINNSPLISLYRELDLDQNTENELGILIDRIDAGIPSRNTAEITQSIVNTYKKRVDTENPISKEEALKLLTEDFGENINNFERVANRPKVYSATDLNIIQDTSATAMKKYTEDGRKILDEIYFDGLSLESQFLLDGFGATKSEAQKKEAALKLTRSEVAYKKLALLLLEVDVPANKVDHHTELINGYLNLSLASKLFAQSLVDPVLAVSGLQIYNYGYGLVTQTN